MYLTGGEFKGLKIEVPKSARPTLSKVRESIFNMLDNLEHGNTFLDMFAGSAIMGLEALSRGYSVTELEIDKKAANIIKTNYAKVNKKPDLIICDSLKYTGKKFDIIYLDPPWMKDYKPIIQKANSLVKDYGLIIVEHENKIEFNEFNLEHLKSKKYGRCLVDVLRNVK